MVDSGSLDELPRERVYGEFKKLFLKSHRPSIGIELMREIGVIDRYFPELKNIQLHKLDQVSKYGDLRFIFATIGIYNPTVIDIFIQKLTMERRLRADVKNFVDAILKFRDGFRAKDVRELSTRVRVDEFLTLYRALNGSKGARYIKSVAKGSKAFKTALKPIISGKELISLGFRPSREFSTILREIYEAQIEGSVRDMDGALNFYKRGVYLVSIFRKVGKLGIYQLELPPFVFWLNLSYPIGSRDDTFGTVELLASFDLSLVFAFPCVGHGLFLVLFRFEW